MATEITTIQLSNELALARCPHCGIDRPRLAMHAKFPTNDFQGSNRRHWATYQCSRCGGVVLAACKGENESGPVVETYPAAIRVDQNIPERAKAYLQQALNSIHSPSGAVMLAASAVDAMLKAKGYRSGNLYPRIMQAEADHFITNEMAMWAHEVRLDANEERHADENYLLPEESDAQHSIEFALALAEFLFVLPARVTRGIQEASPSPSAS